MIRFTLSRCACQGSVTIAVLLGWLILSPSVSAEVRYSGPEANYTILHHFDGLNTGSDPYRVGVTLGRDRSIYGVALSGGRRPNGNYGNGVVYKIDNRGKFKVLHVFDGISGGSPAAAVTLAQDGSIYGTTYMGGKQPFDTGTVYKIDPAGKFRVLHSFDINTEGRTSSEVALAADGSLYGTTFTFGTGLAQKDPATVFKLSADGKYRIIHRFNEASRELPVGGISIGADGSLYGATIYGNPATKGSVYKIGSNGRYQVVYRFTQGYQGNPNSGLTLGADGSLYGTTSSGGFYGYGTVYRINEKGEYAILHHFNGTNGASPVAVTFGRDGKLYGIASSVVNNGSLPEPGPSLLYRLGLDRTFSMLGAFKNPDVQSKLALAPDGNFYGTERSGGLYDSGTVFRIGFPVPSTINFTANKQSLKQGQSITFTASVSGGANITGTVAFLESKGGVNYLGFAPLRQGKAQYSTAQLAPGSHLIYAQYLGNGSYARSTSKPMVISVSP